MDNPFGANLVDRKYQLDGHGLLIPSLGRFPSAASGSGLKPLGDWVHAQGLKFGVHVVRGIPKQAADADLPIAGTNFRAAEAADKADLCGWDDGNYGVRDNAAGQAYYDSMVKQYADWGVDYIKIDCIADHPYKPAEIRQVADAIKHSGRDMVLSLSPGPTDINRAPEVAKLSQLWRISNDIWDAWAFKDHTPDGYPSGVETAFANLAKWNGWAGAGHWPDADMLPFGSLTPHPGMGEPRPSRLTEDETRTMFTLWAIARSPLILGANLTKLDDGLKALLTNKAVIAVNQTAWESYPVRMAADESQTKTRIWMALAGSRQKPTRYLAVFNIGDNGLVITAPVDGGAHAVVDLWTGKRTKTPYGILQVTLPAHGSTIYRVE